MLRQSPGEAPETLTRAKNLKLYVMSELPQQGTGKNQKIPAR